MYGEFGAVRFPAQHDLVRHLIAERFKLKKKPFPMEADKLVFLQGKSVRNSEFDSTDFDFKLSDDERQKTPKAILRDRMRNKIPWAGSEATRQSPNGQRCSRVAQPRRCAATHREHGQQRPEV
jgi:hypothetical protein